jgi:Protein of unknown function (DUF4236)
VGIRFRRSLKLIPGVRLNLSGSGASMSLGARGFHYTVSARGVRTTVGIPGTGLSWSEYRRFHCVRSQSLSRPGPALGHSDPLDSGTTIQSAPIGSIAARSTSELIPILDQLHKRWRLSRATLVVAVFLVLLGISCNAPVFFAASAAVVALVWPGALIVDRSRRSLRLQYDLDSNAQSRVNLFNDAFALLKRSRGLWHVTWETATTDRKHHAGASLLMRRKDLRCGQGRPNLIRGDCSFPFFRFPKQTLYFAPDSILVFSPDSVSALNYRDIEVTARETRFVEDEHPPADATIIANTWQYVNRDGGPDRRFAANRMLPVCLYGEIDLKSSGGLNERIQCSQAETAINFARSIHLMQPEEPYDEAHLGDDSHSKSGCVEEDTKPSSGKLAWAYWSAAILLVCISVAAIDAIYPFARITSSVATIGNFMSRTRSSEIAQNTDTLIQSYRVAPTGQHVETAVPLPRPRPKNLSQPMRLPLKLQQ